MMRPILALSLALTLGACAGDGDAFLDMFATPTPTPTPSLGEGVASGTFGGDSLPVQSAISYRIPLSQGEIASVVLSDDPNLCESFENNEILATSKYLVIELAHVLGTNVSPPDEPGEYSADGAGTDRGTALYARLSDCTWVSNVEVADGTIMLEDVATNRWAGYLNGVTADDETVSVMFNPRNCAALTKFYQSGVLFCQ